MLTPEGTPGCARISNAVTDGANTQPKPTPGHPKTYLEVQYEKGTTEYDIVFLVFKHNIITVIGVNT